MTNEEILRAELIEAGYDVDEWRFVAVLQYWLPYKNCITQVVIPELDYWDVDQYEGLAQRYAARPSAIIEANLYSTLAKYFQERMKTGRDSNVTLEFSRRERVRKTIEELGFKVGVWEARPILKYRPKGRRDLLRYIIPGLFTEQLQISAGLVDSYEYRKDEFLQLMGEEGYYRKLGRAKAIAKYLGYRKGYEEKI